MFESTPAEALLTQRLPSGWGGCWYGCFPAVVTDIQDPDGQGKVKISLPWSPDGSGASYEVWARVATLFAGNNRGSWFIPDVDDEVLIVFEGGNSRHPCVIGGLWNGSDAPPESMAQGNNKKVLCSRNGVKITLDDQDGQEKLLLETPGGCAFTLQDGPGSVELKDSNGNSVKLESSGITVTASAKVTINASQVEVAAGMLTVNAGMSKFSGVVQADTMITNTIIASTYTPGAGNLL